MSPHAELRVEKNQCWLFLRIAEDTLFVFTQLTTVKLFVM